MVLAKLKICITFVIILDLWIFHVTLIEGQKTTRAPSNSGQKTTPTPGLVNCNKTSFQVAAAHIPPYSINQNDKTFGAVITILELTLATCCGSDIQVQYGPWYRKLRDVEENLGNEDIGVPVVRTSLTGISGITGYMFLPVLQASGAALIVKQDRSEGNPILQSLLGSWPLALLVIFSAGVAGIIVWVLDRYWNPDEFPKSFMRGCWEGTWWAYVTMTTVGYGDRAPKSIPARAFGLCWMFVGIIMMSIFTAALASAFTSTGDSDIGNLRGVKTSVVGGSVEHMLAIKEGADITAAQTISQILQMVENGTTDAALVDANYALYEYQKILQYNLEIETTIPNEAVYGMILYNQPTAVEQCMAMKVAQAQFKVFDTMIRSIDRDKKRQQSRASKAVEDVFSGLTTVIIVIACLWGGGFIACMLWEFLYYRPKLRREQKEKGESSESGCFGKMKKDRKISTSELVKDEVTGGERKDKEFLKQESLFAKEGIVSHP